MVKNYGFLCHPNSTSAEGMPTSDFGWESYPEGMFEAIKLVTMYRRSLYITENGTADAKDVLRPNFLIDHLKVLDKAINEEKVDLRGYFHWSLTDNYEWAEGYSKRFGLYSVDLDTKKRTDRKSANIYKKIIERKE